MPFIMITVFIDMMAIGLIVPVLPPLVAGFAAGPAEAAYWYGVVAFAFGIANFFGAPLLGALSDRYGRRPVLLLGFCGLALNFFATALATSLWVLVLVRLVGGAMQANAAVANAYVADITPPEERARRFGLLGAMFGLGFIAGPVAGGLLGAIDLHLPFYAAGTLALVNLLYGWLVLPESLPPEKRARKFDWSHANPLGSIVLLRRYPQVFGLAAVVFIANLAHYVYPSIFVLFADYMYQWGPREVGWVLAAVGVCSVIVQAGLVGRVVHAIGERRALLLGLSCGLVGFGIYGFADAGWMFLVGIPISAIWGLAAPSTQALITRQVGADVQGRIQGALMSLVSMAGIIGPGIFAGSFGWFIGPSAPLHLPGAPFLIAALLLGVAVLIAWRHARVPATVPAAARVDTA